MGYKRAILLFILAAIIAVHAAAAAQFNVSANAVNNQIQHNQQATFNVTITNNYNTTDTYRMTFVDLNWRIRSNPLSYYLSGVELKPGESITFPMILTPTDNLPYNTYILSMKVASEKTGEVQSVVLPVALLSPGKPIGEYLTAVKRIVDYPTDVDPRNPVPITINLKNRNPKNLTEFDIHIESAYFSKWINSSLQPLESKVLSANVTLPSDLSPGSVPFDVVFIADGSKLSPSFDEKLNVMEYNDIRSSSERQNGFFKTSSIITYDNRGNHQTEVMGAKKVNLVTRPFATVFLNDKHIDKAYITNDSGIYLQWRFSMPKGEKDTVRVVFNYILIFWIIVFLLLGAGVYQLMKSPITVKKDAVVVGVSEGGISEIRVVVHLKNLTGRKFKSINVIDSIPKLAQFVPDKEESLVSSRLYSNEKEGSVVKWNIDGLERYEERIFNYRVKSKLSIVGGLSLPRTLIRFTDEQGSEQITRSNPVRVNL